MILIKSWLNAFVCAGASLKDNVRLRGESVFNRFLSTRGRFRRGNLKAPDVLRSAITALEADRAAIVIATIAESQGGKISIA